MRNEGVRPVENFLLQSIQFLLLLPFITAAERRLRRADREVSETYRRLIAQGRLPLIQDGRSKTQHGDITVVHI